MVKVNPAGREFAFNLLRETLKVDAGKNVFISPASISVALAMTMNGARGQTLKDMAQALGLPTDEHQLHLINSTYAKLLKRLTEGEPKPLQQTRCCGGEEHCAVPKQPAEETNVKLLIANSLWSRLGVKFKDEFLAANKQHFNAEVTALNFADPTAPKIINNWCHENTNGKISEIVDKISDDTILFLLNAIWFYGPWTYKFDPAATKEEDFKLSDGSTKKQPLMHQEGEYRYLRGDKFQAVSLPYGEDQRFSMYFLLPDEDSNLCELQSKLNASNWSNWQAQFASTPGEIRIPRFKLEYSLSLNEVLKSMGMGSAFDKGAADFSGMIAPPDRPYVSNVKHKTFVEVSEKGTEAAAVTSVEVGIECVRIPPQPFSMTVNRPFACVIQDNNTGTILFLGSVVDPSK
jgi:serpin B